MICPSQAGKKLTDVLLIDIAVAVQVTHNTTGWMGYRLPRKATLKQAEIRLIGIIVAVQISLSTTGGERPCPTRSSHTLMRGANPPIIGRPRLQSPAIVARTRLRDLERRRIYSTKMAAVLGSIRTRPNQIGVNP